MIEHVSLHCSDVKASRNFYEKTLRPLGYRLSQDFPDAVGFMAEGHTSFWVSRGKIGPQHIAFRAKDRKAVEAFHRAALEAGAKDHGAPGLRKDYSPTYYAAYVLDPDGNNMEAVTFVRGPRAKPRKGAAKRPAVKPRTRH